MSWSSNEAKRGPAPHWTWALVFVAAIHLLTSAGRWIVNDHAEMILMSQRLLSHGTFTVPPEGPTVVGVDPGPSGHPRFLPVTALALTPLVLLDRLFGWGAPPLFGVLVHLGGHAYALLALGLLACAARRGGASPAAAAMVVLLLGTSWPLWQISRRGGAEPIMACLIALFLWGSVARSRVARAFACIVLPWTNPAGFLFALTLAVFQPVDWAAARETVEQRHLVADRMREALLAFLSLGSVILVWNVMYHGDWWGGGYGAWARSPWLSEPPLKLFFDWYLSQCALQVPVLMMFSLLLLARGRRGLDLLIQPAAVLLVIAAFFSIYAPSIGQDPIRRLSVTWLGFGLAVGLAWPGFGLTRFATAGFAALNLLVGVYWFQLGEFNHYPRPGGFFYPLVIWVTWLVKGRSPILYGGYVLACVLIGGLAAFKLARLFRADCEPPLPASVRKSVTSH